MAKGRLSTAFERVLRVVLSIALATGVLASAARVDAVEPRPSWRESLAALVGPGACLVAKLDGTPLLALHESTPLPPASTLKVLTALAALEQLGPDYRFTTVLTSGPGGEICVRGEGDPFLVSEEIESIAGEIRSMGVARVGRILLDQTFFQRGLEIPGVGSSTNPYDALNRALSANFNTVGFVVRQGRTLPIEPQTPITECARRIARIAGPKAGEVRLSFSPGARDCPLYPGELLEAFLEKQGIQVSGPIEEVADGKSCQGETWIVHRSSHSLRQVVEDMLAYSNNFIANQILLVMGARRLGEPATLEKGVRVLEEHVKDRLRFQDAHAIEEGSGIGRGNRMSARDLLQVLLAFAPHRALLREEDGVRFKTGSLAGVSNLAGYLPGRDGEDLPFVVLLQGGLAERKKVLDLLVRNLAGGEATEAAAASSRR